MKRIAIIGGGVGGLTAAHALTRKDLKGEYEVTVFQMGWRLGGKCATGRGENGRIEEHGIHAFLGAYYNALWMMRDVYKEWEEIDKPAADKAFVRRNSKEETDRDVFERAFVKQNTGLHWERHAGSLKRWNKWSPKSTKSDLDKIRKSKDFIVVLWLKRYAEVLLARIADIPFNSDDVDLPIDKKFEKIFELLKQFSKLAEQLLEKGDQLSVSKDGPAVIKALNDFWRDIQVFLNYPIVHSNQNLDGIRRNLLEVELFQVILTGIGEDSLLIDGFKKIDEKNFDEWLEEHGASNDLLESPLVSYIANLTFQFPKGDVAVEPQMSAASYLQWALRSALYVDYPLYLFAAGTGETLITPIYEVLKARGVKFKFFHELTDVITTPKGDRVTELKFQEQARLLSDTKEYQPFQLPKIKGLSCWPNKPLFDQLEKEDNIEITDFERPETATFGSSDITFSVGNKPEDDFSEVILAIPPQAICQSAKSLMKRNKHWGSKIPNMPTTATQANQLWFKTSIEGLAGMDAHTLEGKRTRHYYASANFPGEMHGQLDFSKYIDFEDWPEDDKPSGLLYGCGVMVDTHEEGLTPRRVSDVRAKESTRSMLTLAGADLLPNSVVQRNPTLNPNALDFNDLHVDQDDGGDDIEGQLRLDSQYFRGNVYPSDRYTQSPPKTKSLRINPLKPEIENMTGAGDWVDTVLNVGSVECTVMGGLLAAAFIHDKEDAKDIIGAWVTPADSLL